MKDGLDRNAVRRLRTALEAADPAFDGVAFERRALRGLPPLELKARVAHLISALAEGLPADFQQALPIVLDAGQSFPAGDPDDPLRGFAAWPLVDWVAVYGTEYLETSLAALRRLTPLFSAEFAVRPFLIADPQRALAILSAWLDDPDPNVRRLISEGTRPRLPWGAQLPAFRRDPQPVLSLLTRLRDDPAEYVRRSVANNLNDIAKDHPALVVETARAWWREAGPARQAVVRHGLRTLVKQGDPAALRVLGFTTRPRVEATFRASAATLRIGESLELELLLRSTGRRRQRLVVDYVVHYQRAGGKTGAKVFKWRNIELPTGGEVRLSRKHAFVPRSVRRLYAGEHRLEVQVAGRVLAALKIDLEP